MGPSVRKLVLTAHITSSVGCLGAVIAFLALATAALTTSDAQVVRGAYVAMNSIGWSVLVPLSVASLVTGVVQSLGTRWGLLRHYWVVVKLMMTVLATAILLMYTQTLDSLAVAVADPTLSNLELLERRSFSPVLHAGGGLVLLLAATVLSIYKPRGLTRYGQRGGARRRDLPSS